jgi:hypothetical protein
MQLRKTDTAGPGLPRAGVGCRPSVSHHAALLLLLAGVVFHAFACQKAGLRESLGKERHSHARASRPPAAARSVAGHSCRIGRSQSMTPCMPDRGTTFTAWIDRLFFSRRAMAWSSSTDMARLSAVSHLFLVGVGRFPRNSACPQMHSVVPELFIELYTVYYAHAMCFG